MVFLSGSCISFRPVIFRKWDVRGGFRPSQAWPTLLLRLLSVSDNLNAARAAWQVGFHGNRSRIV